MTMEGIAMKAAWYERKGTAAAVLQTSDMPTPQPAAGEVRVRVAYSGINPGDIKKREGWLGYGMPYPRIIPHSDGSGIVEAVGDGVATSHVGQRVWIVGAQSYRPFGTAAKFVTVPQELAIPLPDSIDLATGACLGISARTAHRCVFADGPVAGKTLLVSGGAGNVGHAAISLAAWAGARVIATVGSPAQMAVAQTAGANIVLDRHRPDLIDAIRRESGPSGIDRIVEVAFGANIATDEQVIATGGTIVAYASDTDAAPTVPFWDLLFRNVVIRLVGSDDLPAEAERQAIADITACLEDGRLHPIIAATFPLKRIAEAHDLVDRGAGGHVLLGIDELE